MKYNILISGILAGIEAADQYEAIEMAKQAIERDTSFLLDITAECLNP